MPIDQAVIVLDRPLDRAVRAAERAEIDEVAGDRKACVQGARGIEGGTRSPSRDCPRPRRKRTCRRVCRCRRPRTQARRARPRARAAHRRRALQQMRAGPRPCLRFIFFLPRPSRPFLVPRNLVPHAARARTFSDVEGGVRSPKTADRARRPGGYPAAAAAFPPLAMSHTCHAPARSAIQTPRQALASKVARGGPLLSRFGLAPWKVSTGRAAAPSGSSSSRSSSGCSGCSA